MSRCSVESESDFKTIQEKILASTNRKVLANMVTLFKP
jgi:hypothetical protein